MNLRHTAGALVGLAAAGGAIAGCGDSSSGASSAPPARSTQQPKSVAPSTSNVGSGSPAVSVENFKFMPPSLTVAPDARITITNHDITAHTATADSGGSFDTGEIAPGSSATVRLSKPGTYRYHCDIHPFMHGTLVVH